MLGPFGIKGAMIHIPFHGFMKITLFLCAGAIMAITGKKADQSSWPASAGGCRSPWPPSRSGPSGCAERRRWRGSSASGFCAWAPSQSGHGVFLAVILVSSLLDVIYFFPIVKTAFFDASPADSGEAGTSRRVTEWQRPLYGFMVVPLAVTAVFSIVLCFFPGALFFMDLVEQAVAGLF